MNSEGTHADRTVTALLSPESATAFLDRFWNFYDGVIRRIALDLPRQRSAQIGKVDVLARDKKADDAWVVCTLQLLGLQEFVIREGKTSFLVLSDGLKLVWDSGRVFIDFGTGEDKPTLEDIRSAGFYLSGQRVEWSVRPLAADEWS
jgi:hypothetical protein